MVGTIGSKLPTTVFSKLLWVGRPTWLRHVLFPGKQSGAKLVVDEMAAATISSDVVRDLIGHSRSGPSNLIDAPRDDGAAVVMSSGDALHLGAIIQPHIALAIWWRPVPVAVSRCDIENFTPIRESIHRDQVGASMSSALAAALPRALGGALAADIADLAMRFADLMNVDRLAIRLEAVTGNACSKFHADYVQARLITTYHGPGIEWTLGNDDEMGQIHRLATGHFGVFKGRGWAPNLQVLHRSPAIAGTDDVRLLLVIDIAAEDTVGPL